MAPWVRSHRFRTAEHRRSPHNAARTTQEEFIQAEATVREAPGPGLGLGIERGADLLSRTVQRAFETPRSLSPAAEKTIATQVIDLFAGLGEADRADLGIEEEPAPGPRKCTARR